MVGGGGVMVCRSYISGAMYVSLTLFDLDVRHS
jgi:hypothetical protein